MGTLSDLGDWIKETARERLNWKTIAAEAFETLTDRIIPQGAAELTQALYSGHAYVPYGPGQAPLPVEPSNIGLTSPAPDIAVASPEPAPSIQEQYEQALSMYAAMRSGEEPDRGISR